MKDFINAITEFKETFDELVVDIIDDKSEWKVIKIILHSSPDCYLLVEINSDQEQDSLRMCVLERVQFGYSSTSSIMNSLADCFDCLGETYEMGTNTETGTSTGR
jgi:hypothetical protein